MLQYLGALVLSFVVTNWIYAEALLFMPSLGPVSERIISVLKIPTHDEWPDIMNSKSAKNLGREVDQVLGESQFSDKMVEVGILDPEVRHMAATRGYFFNWGEAGDSAAGIEGSGQPFLTGEEIFVKTTRAGDPVGNYELFSFASLL